MAVDTYTVEPGDTVWGIADELASSVDAIVKANDLAHGGRLIYPGDVLEIPAAHPRGSATRQRSTTRVEPAATHPAARTAGPDERRIEIHVVEPGDTVGALAVRYHAWTAELIEANGGSTTLQVGQRLRVPVVVGAEQRARRENRAPDDAEPRTAVRRVITRTAENLGVDPDLALAVSWQEAGWQQGVVSKADAVGAMQVIPSTGRWMSEMTGRDLDLHDVEDNVYAGVVLLKLLTDRTSTRRALAGYYQGLAAVEEHGLYDDTRRYVDNVLAIRRDFAQGSYPY